MNLPEDAQARAAAEQMVEQAVAASFTGLHIQTVVVNLMLAFAVGRAAQATQRERNEGQVRLANAVTQAVAAERQWWIAREDDDFPCVTAGAPKGSCKHEGWAECLYAAAALARRTLLTQLKETPREQNAQPV